MAYGFGRERDRDRERQHSRSHSYQTRHYLLGTIANVHVDLVLEEYLGNIHVSMPSGAVNDGLAVVAQRRVSSWWIAQHQQHSRTRRNLAM